MALPERENRRARPIILYEYQPDRKAKRPEEFLSGFQGYLHVDGYSGYRHLPSSVVIVGCFAHARRKFEETLKAMASDTRSTSLAYKAKHFCDRLFELERSFATLDAQERQRQRMELSKPELNAFFAWLKSLQTAPQSLFGKAVSYCLNQEQYLRRNLLDGRLEISNNLAERSIRPFVVGRKNFLFANTPRGAEASAIIYSLVETAKACQINPYDYLLQCLKRAPDLHLGEHPEHASLPFPENFKK